MKSSLSPMEQAVAYWLGLGAPLTHMAAALQRNPTEIQSALANVQALQPSLRSLQGYPSPTLWIDRTVNTLIRLALSRPPQQELAYVSGKASMRVADVRDSVARIAAGLRATGITKGSCVAVDAIQRYESYLVVMAALLLGATVVRLSLSNGLSGIKQMLLAAPSSVTFTSLSFDLGDFPEAGRVVDLDDDFKAFIKSSPRGDLPDVAVSPGDVAVVGYTSGSTGEPKAVQLTHEAVFRSSEVMQQIFQFSNTDVFCTSTDFSALSGLRSMLTMPFISGGRVLLPSAAARAQPLALAEECAKYGVTRLTAVPAVLRGMAKGRDRIGSFPLPQLRSVFSGSGVLDQATHDEFVEAFEVPVYDYYASREFGTIAYAGSDKKTMSSAGGRICNALVQIIDQNGELLPSGSIGEIMVHSDGIARSAVSSEFPQWLGWHQSGDLGKIDPESGGLRVMGRKRDVIKGTDGSLIFPAHIENLMNSLPIIRESCVFGWADSSGKESIIAAVVLHGDSSDIEQAARTHILKEAGRYCVPDRIIVVDEFPRVASLKIDKGKLKEQLATLLSKT